MSLTVRHTFRTRDEALRWVLSQNLVTLALETDYIEGYILTNGDQIDSFLVRCAEAVADQRGELTVKDERTAGQIVRKMLDNWSGDVQPLQDRVVELLHDKTHVGALVLDPLAKRTRQVPCGECMECRFYPMGGDRCTDPKEVEEDD